MKKIVFALAAIIAVAALILALPVSHKQSDDADSYLRIHIRANSNSDEDQELKYKVKQAVVDFMTPLLVNADTKERALSIVRSNFKGIESAADAVIKANGFSYSSKASLRREDFPTRRYGEFTLESGVYDALILELGTGKGDNWWCVVYPPLCFVNGTDNGSYGVVYRSLLKEIIEKFKSEKD